MKLRSSLLLACMAVVPVVAMFSHKIPREWRLAVQRLARGESLAPANVRAATTVGPPTVDPAPASPVIAAPPASDTTPLQAVAPPPPPLESPAIMPLERPSIPSPAGDDVSRVRTEVEEQLASLGAVSFECVRMTGGSLHRCSCRVPADPSGQLQRVFQSSNPDPVIALRNLLGQVRFWKHRVASRTDVGNPLRAPGDAGQSGLR